MKIVVGLSSLALAFILTGVVKTYALKVRMLDIPNERSSHEVVRPRGGGIAIVIAFSISLLGLATIYPVARQPLLLLACAGALVAMIGYVDDRFSVPVIPRIAIHIGAAVTILVFAPGDLQLSFGHFSIRSEAILLFLGVLYIVWMLNLYNFMDGIDGIAGIEAVTCAFAIAGLLLASDREIGALVALALGAASLGFLLWNWPPAKIFMGDVGSAYLGFMFAALSVIMHAAGWIDFWIWPILLGAFVVDATVTLMRRFLRGERVYQAHRTHAYQHAAQRFGHLRVSLSVGALNIFWLLPIAASVLTGLLPGYAALIVAYIPLIWLALSNGAGQQSNTSGK